MHLCSIKFSERPDDEQARALMRGLMERHACEAAGGCRLIPWLFDSQRGALLIAAFGMETETDERAAMDAARQAVDECLGASGGEQLRPIACEREALDADAIEHAWDMIYTHRADGMFNPRIFECIANLDYRRINLERVLTAVVKHKLDMLGGAGAPDYRSAMQSTDTDNGKEPDGFKSRPGEEEPIPKPPQQPDEQSEESVPASEREAAHSESAPARPEKEKFSERPQAGGRVPVDVRGSLETRVEDMLRADVAGMPQLRAEAEAVRAMYAAASRAGRALPVFSYFVDAGRGEYARLIAAALMDAVDGARGVTRAGIEPLVTADFRSRAERSIDSRPDYDELRKRLYGRHMCLTDAGALSALTQKDFDGLIEFLRPLADTHMVFCGDLEPMGAHLRARCAGVEALVNVRRLSLRGALIDEHALIAKALSGEGLDASGCADELERAWRRYRERRGGADMAGSMTRFVSRTVLAHYEALSAGGADSAALEPAALSWVNAEAGAEHDEGATTDARAELNAMVGLNSVKRTVSSVTAHAVMARRKEQAGLGAARPTYTFLMLGAPGTGKTTVAMLMGRIFRELGLLRSGHVVTAGRADLVGAYLGHTALKTTELFTSALGGVLFVDEAYSLVSGDRADTYGSEALATLTQLMTDHMGELCVIFAGYDRPMQNMLDANPGLRHRFAYTLKFEDYTCDEMQAIFDLKAAARRLRFEPGCRERIGAQIERVTRARGENFANGRIVDNLLQYIVGAQEERLAARELAGDRPSDDELNLIALPDCEAAFENDAVKDLGRDTRRRVGF